MLKRRLRRGESGQTLILALAFVAVFSVMAASVLAFASTVERQRGATERTATTASVAEGAAHFALADTARHPCGTAGGGSLQFVKTIPGTVREDTLQYGHPDGSPGGGTYSCSTVPSGGPTSGINCFLCLLNNLPNPTATNPVLSIPNRAVTINGEIDSNGSIVGSGSGSKFSGNPVKLYTGATCTICTSPFSTSTSAFPDPLVGKLPTPTYSTAPTPQNCNPCTGVLHPGTFSGITTGSTVWMTAGTYIVTGGITISGNGNLSNTDCNRVSLCSTATPATIHYVGTTLTDTSKAWTAGQWVGAVVTVTFPDGTSEQNTVTANTGTTLTLGATWGVPPLDGDGYAVVAPAVIYLACPKPTSPYYGSCATDASNPANTDAGSGAGVTYVTSNGQPNSVTDTSKSWAVNRWVNATVASGTSTGVVTSNTSNTLTIGTKWNPKPHSGDAYVVSTVTYPTSPTNTVQDTSKTWTINQWSGATVTATLSGGGTTTATVSSNTANTLTVGAWSNGTPTIGNPYTMATSGGYVYTSGNGVLSITASQSGPYAGVSLFTDPGLQNPAFTTCDATAKAVICVAGNGGNIGGTVYVPKGTVDLQGGGSSGVLTVAGYLVIRDLIMTGSETLNVTGPDKNNASCDYFDDPVVGMSGPDGHFPGGSSLSARVEFNANCITGHTSIVNFDYDR